MPRHAPESRPGAIDFEHLERQTHGDAALEREVLHLFDAQCERLGAEVAGADPAPRAEAVHALVGAARAIGAWRVAELAGALEGQPRTQSDDLVHDFLAALSDARAAARARAGRPGDAPAP